MAVPEWMRQNLVLLRAEYQEKISSKSNTGKPVLPHRRVGGVWTLMELQWPWAKIEVERGGGSFHPTVARVRPIGADDQ